jgi:hypothetical protein
MRAVDDHRQASLYGPAWRLPGDPHARERFHEEKDRSLLPVRVRAETTHGEHRCGRRTSDFGRLKLPVQMPSETGFGTITTSCRIHRGAFRPRSLDLGNCPLCHSCVLAFVSSLCDGLKQHPLTVAFRPARGGPGDLDLVYSAEDAAWFG